MENSVNVAPYISELLFRHDCVVVPGFGGFVCTYAPARIHPAQHTFQPPSKQIVFNKHLQQNDGLLAHTISAAVPCAFEEAMAGIDTFVATSNTQLKAGQKVVLKNLGTLWLDVERNICFEADADVNYLIDAFGLGTFRSLPILREQTTEVRKTETKREDRPAVEERPVVPVVNRRRRLVTALAIGLPLLLTVALIPSFTHSGKGTWAGFGLFGKTEPSLYTPIHWSVPKLVFIKESSSLPAPDSLGNSTLVLGDKSMPIPVRVMPVAPESTNVAGASQAVIQANTAKPKGFHQGSYYVIGGCFGVAENASKFQHQLLDKGYQAEVLENVKSKLTHISLASFMTRAEAEAFLQKVKGDVPEAWVLHR